MTAQHTPGPLKVETVTTLAGGLPADGQMWVHRVVRAEPFNEPVCEIVAVDGRGEADARLHAAAPLMLEALKRYAHDAETFSDGVSGLLFSDLVGDTHTAALAAIRAATGEDA